MVQHPLESAGGGFPFSRASKGRTEGASGGIISLENTTSHRNFILPSATPLGKASRRRSPGDTYDIQAPLSLSLSPSAVAPAYILSRSRSLARALMLMLENILELRVAV